MRNYFITAILVLFCAHAYSQDFTNTVKGVVKDAFTGETLVNATIELTVDTLTLYTTSDLEGKFSFEKVKAGRVNLQTNHVGYEPYFANNLILASGKALEVEIKMEQSIQSLAEVTVVARKQGEVNNELAYVSSRSFNVKETERYAGTRRTPRDGLLFCRGRQQAILVMISSSGEIHRLDYSICWKESPFPTQTILPPWEPTGVLFRC